MAVERRRRLQTARGLHPFFPSEEAHVLATLPPRTPLEVLRRLGTAELRSRQDLRGSHNLGGGSGGQFGHFVEVGPYFVKTADDRHHADLESALEAEREPEVLRCSLDLYPPDRWLVFVEGAGGGVWCCSVAKRFETLRELFNRRRADGLCWRLYLEALELGFGLLDRHRLLLDCNPNNFGIDQGRIYYLDDDILPVSGPVALGTQALLRLREYADARLDDRRRFLLAFEALLRRHDRERLRRWGILGDLETVVLWPGEKELRQVLERLRLWLLSTRRES